MALQGIVSSGCKSDAAGDGCIIDDFLDETCQLGAPVFSLCNVLGADSLVEVYVACFQDFRASRDIIACYSDLLDDTSTVNCSLAHSVCAE